jgi:neutral trehalase
VQLRKKKSSGAVFQWLLSPARAAVALLRRGPTRQQHQQRIQRLAEESIDVARSMEADLRDLRRSAELEQLYEHVKECRGRARQATSRWRPGKDLEETAEQLHQDHWRIVSLRSELDAIMSGRPRERGTNTRSCKFATGSKPVRSRWSTISSPTRPALL